MRLDPRSIHSLDQVVMVKGDLMDVETLAHHVIDGVYMKVFRAPKAGLFIGQHAHTYEHAHLVSAGAFRVFANGAEIGDFGPGEVVRIRAGVPHALLSLEDGSVGTCVHNTHGLAEPDVADEYEFPQ